MIGFETVATTSGLIIGILCGLVPFAVGLYHKQVQAGVIGWLACALSGFACGFLGGIPMILFATAVVMSFAYVNRQDPFTSRASIEEVDFEETTSEFVMRQLAGLGNYIRQTSRILLRNKGGFIGFLGIMFFIIMSVFGPLVIEYDGRTHIDRRREGANTLFSMPSAEYPLGLDYKGRDIMSHIVYGGQDLIITSIQAGLISTVIAVTLGAVAALVGGLVDQVLSAISNFILTIPQFPLLLVLAGIITFDSSLMLAVLLGLLTWPGLMRAVRAQVLSLRERDYVQAAIALDLGLFHIITREVFPNLISYVAINMIFSIRTAMYSIVGLVVLGLVPLEEPDWGYMIFLGRQQGALFNPEAAMMLVAPIMAIALFQLSLVLFTRALEELFNPRLRSGL